VSHRSRLHPSSSLIQFDRHPAFCAGLPANSRGRRLYRAIRFYKSFDECELGRRRRTEIATTAARAGASHPYIVKVINKSAHFALPFQEERNLEVSVCFRFCPDSSPGQIGAANQSNSSVNYENLSVHSYAMKKLNARAQQARAVKLFVSSAKRRGWQLGMNYA